MAAARGGGDAPLSEELFERPARFQFFQLVRLLRKLHAGRAPVGRDEDPADEFVRFRSDLDYGFPIGDVRSLEAGEPRDGSERAVPDDLTVNFFGLATPNSFGSLPTPYVEEIRRQIRDRQPAMRDFLDLFNHRLVSLFYRAWERSRPDVLHDLGEHSPFESALHALIGLEPDVLRARVPGDSRDWLARAGLLGMRPASQSAVEGLVESLLGIPARVEPFLPAWYEIDPDDRTRLGTLNCRLGDDACLGAEVCLAQWRFRVVVGPMDLETYLPLLPDGEAFPMLCAAIRLAVGPEYDFEINLVLDRDAVPVLRLGAPEPDAPPCRLGWSTWLERGAGRGHADEPVYAPHLAAEEALQRGREEERRG
jgi:type VI secretion system protein ImpH